MTPEAEPVARELAQELSRPLSLWRIEEGLEGMIQARQDITDVLAEEGREFLAAEVTELREALSNIDAQIEAYLTREAEKVQSYAALIRREQYEADACTREIARLQELLERHEATVDRLKATAKAVMQRFGVRELRSPTASLRLVGNGGVQALDTNLPALGDEWTLSVVTLPTKAWQSILHSQRVGAVVSTETLKAAETSRCVKPNNSRIRNALTERVPCDLCDGKGRHSDWMNETEGVQYEKCPKCEGRGTVPRQVPGARLLPRGERVEVK